MKVRRYAACSTCAAEIGAPCTDQRVGCAGQVMRGVHRGRRLAVKAAWRAPPKARSECDRLAEVSADSQLIGEFFEWLGGQGYSLARYRREVYLDGGKRRPRAEDVLVPATCPIERLLAAFFGIDLAKVERERRALLGELRRKG